MEEKVYNSDELTQNENNINNGVDVDNGDFEETVPDDSIITEDTVDWADEEAPNTSNGITFNQVSPTNISANSQLFQLGFTIPNGSTFAGIQIRSNWVEQVSSTRTGNTYTAFLEVQGNYTTVQRECEIVVYADNQTLSSTFILKQARGFTPITLVYDDIQIDSEGGNNIPVPINIIPNFDVSLCNFIRDGVWIKEVSIDKRSENLLFSADKNNTTKTRYGSITIRYDNSYTTKLEVIQKPNETYFKLSKDVVDLNGSDRTVEYVVTENAELKNVEKRYADEWFEYTHNVETRTIKVTATQVNLTGNIRKGYIDFYVDNGETYLTYTITVEQSPISVGGFFPEALVFDAEGNPISTDYASIDFGDYKLSFYEWTPDPSEIPDWYTLSWNDSTYKATVTRIEPNNTTETRTFREIMIGSILIDEETGATFRQEFPISIIQQPALPYVECGIWKDTFYTLNKTDHSQYKYYRIINKDNNIGEIYRGRIFFITDVINIKINDIARNQMEYLKNPLQTEYTDNNGYVNLQFQVSETGDIWEGLEDYHFFNNYSYDDKINDILPMLSKSIFDTLDKRQYFITSFQDYYSTTGRSNTTLLVSNVGSSSTTSRFNAKNSQNTIAYKVEAYNDIYMRFEHNDSKIWHYEVKDTCKPYCVYYLDRNGGWCWLNCANGERENNQITPYFYNQNVNNTFSDTFENTMYLKEYKEQWKLNTPLLTDEQSKLMKDVFLSPVVYLHLLEEDKVIAVNIVDKVWQQQTFKGNKKKPFFCTFTVENSQNKIIV